MLFVFAGLIYNKASLSMLIVEDKTISILEIQKGEWDWKVVFLESHLRESRLWSHVANIQRGILVPPLKLMLLIILLRRATHILYGECTLHPLTIDELILAEDLMKRRFKFLSAKEAIAKKKFDSEKKKRKLYETVSIDRVRLEVYAFWFDKTISLERRLTRLEASW